VSHVGNYLVTAVAVSVALLIISSVIGVYS